MAGGGYGGYDDDEWGDDKYYQGHRYKVRKFKTKQKRKMPVWQC